MEEVRARLERLLLENIVPFWYPHTLDRWRGGYRLNHDVHGKWLGPDNKMLISQSRTLWFFSRLYRSPYGKPEHLEAARHGFRFLRRRLWDARHGGFFWSVTPWGRRPVREQKHVYGQSFGLYALAEYARASNDAGAKQLATRLFALLEENAHDTEYGGYVEAFTRDWTPLPDGERTYLLPAGTKSMNTQLHVLEALMPYFRLCGDGRVRERLIELTGILGGTVVRDGIGACSAAHMRDWTPLRGDEHDRVSYGHDVENVWLLIEAGRALGRPPGERLDVYRTLFDYSLEYGFDHEEGGFYFSGPLDAPADRLERIYWAVSEGLVASLYMSQLTGDERYEAAFRKTLEWIERHQADWTNGDWHLRVVDGRPDGGKAGKWKSPYHNGRAVLQCLRRLNEPLASC